MERWQHNLEHGCVVLLYNPCLDQHEVDTIIYTLPPHTTTSGDHSEESAVWLYEEAHHHPQSSALPLKAGHPPGLGLLSGVSV